MKILMLHNHYRIRSGEDESTESECSLLRQYGHTVDLHTISNDDIEQLGTVRTALRALWSRPAYDEVVRRIRGSRYDLVHVQNFFPLLSPSVIHAAHDEGIAVVHTLRNYRLLCPAATLFRDHAPCYSCAPKRIKWPSVVHGCYRESRVGASVVAAMLAYHASIGTWQRVNAMIALSEKMKERFCASGFPAEKIFVKPNFVFSDPGPGKGVRGYALYVGRLSKEKGVSTLVTAWRDIGNRLPLKIVGEGDVAVPATDGVELLGRVPLQAVYKLMQGALMLVFPSEWHEPFGRSIIESFAAGTPVVVSNIGGGVELVQDGITGVHFQAGDSADLAAKVLAALQDRAALEKMGFASRRAFEENYSGAANIGQLLSIYEHAINDARQKRHTEPESNVQAH